MCLVFTKADIILSLLKCASLTRSDATDQRAIVFDTFLTISEFCFNTFYNNQKCEWGNLISHQLITNYGLLVGSISRRETLTHTLASVNNFSLEDFTVN